MECGYACSDNASWHRVGSHVVNPEEVVLHPAMHTARDTMDQVNIGQVTEFVKLAMGHSIELGDL